MNEAVARANDLVHAGPELAHEYAQLAGWAAAEKVLGEHALVKALADAVRALQAQVRRHQFFAAGAPAVDMELVVFETMHARRLVRLREKEVQDHPAYFNYEAACEAIGRKADVDGLLRKYQGVS